jgi:hypothetical protein
MRSTSKQRALANVVPEEALSRERRWLEATASHQRGAIRTASRETAST